MHARRFGPDCHHGRLVPIGIVVGTHEYYLQRVDQNLAPRRWPRPSDSGSAAVRELINFVDGGAAVCIKSAGRIRGSQGDASAAQPRVAPCSYSSLTGGISNAADTWTGVGDGCRRLGCHPETADRRQTSVAARPQVANHQPGPQVPAYRQGRESTLATSWRRPGPQGLIARPTASRHDSVERGQPLMNKPREYL